MFHLTGCVVSFAPRAMTAAVAANQGRSDNQSEDGTAVIAAAGCPRTLVLGKTRPEFRSRTGLQRVRAHPYDSWPLARIRPVLSRFAKEIDASFRP